MVSCVSRWLVGGRAGEAEALGSSGLQTADSSFRRRLGRESTLPLLMAVTGHHGTSLGTSCLSSLWAMSWQRATAIPGRA